MAAAVPVIASVAAGAVASKVLAPDAPKQPAKSAEQLEAEQQVRLDKFEQQGKQRKTSAATQAGLTRQSLLGNLGGTQSPLGVNPASSIRNAMGG